MYSNTMGRKAVGTRKMNRQQYPRNWTEISYNCKKAAGFKCQKCGVRQGTTRYSKRTGAEYTVYLHSAHLDHDRENPSPRLASLCPTCHGKYDFLCRVRKAEGRLLSLKLARERANRLDLQKNKRYN